LNAKKFDEHFAQSAIHRIGYKKWNRNIKVK
jgi:epoxyqueuosine reductase QueG